MINKILKFGRNIPLRIVGLSSLIFLTSFLFYSTFFQSAGTINAQTTDTFLQNLPVILNNAPYIETIFGIHLKEITPEQGLNQVDNAGALYLRRNMIWRRVETTEGARHWDQVLGLENELITASDRGLRTILIVHGTPPWAQSLPGISCGPIKADKIEAFAQFMHDAVARYSGPPYNVKYWEIWNEPDASPALVNDNSDFGCWGDPSDPYYGGGYYADMLKAVYPQIKAADPDAQVIVGGLLMGCDPNIVPPPASNCAMSNFLEGILNNGGGPFFDGISFHAYDFGWPGLGAGLYANTHWNTAYNTTGPVALVKGQFLRDVLAQYGVTNKSLTNTETGIICDDCINDPNFELTKAYYVAQSYASAINEGLFANIWYSALGWRNSGLLETNLNPRPAYHAYVAAANLIGNSTGLGPVTSADVTNASRVFGYKLQLVDREIWVIWSKDGGSFNISFNPGTPTAVFDVFGNAISPSHSMTIGIAPRYIEWNP